MKLHTHGFIALTAVLILSAIFLSMTLTMTMHAVSGAETTIAFQERDTARYLAHGCLEYARMELQRTLDYQGNERILIGESACEILNIEGSGNTNRLLRVESSVGVHTFRIQEVIAEVSPDLIIMSSERIVSF